MIRAVKGGRGRLWLDGQRVCFKDFKPTGAYQGRVDDSEEAICGGTQPDISRVLPGLQMPRFVIQARPTAGEWPLWLSWLGFNVITGVKREWSVDALAKEIKIDYVVGSAVLTGGVVSKARISAARGGMPTMVTAEIQARSLVLGTTIPTAQNGNLLGGPPLPFTGGAFLLASPDGTVQAARDLNRATIAIDNHATPDINARTTADAITFAHNTTHFGFGSALGTNSWDFMKKSHENAGKSSAKFKLQVGGNEMEWVFPRLDEPSALPSIDGREADIDVPHYMKAYQNRAAGETYYVNWTAAA